MAGPAVSSGAENQAGVAAYVGVRMLLVRRLGWDPLTDDVPSAIEGEVGGPGDDFRISFGSRREPLETQCKRSLTGRAGVAATIEEMIRRGGDANSIDLVLVVGSGSSAEVRDKFAADVRSYRQGQRDRLGPLIQRVIAEVAGAEAILSRLNVVTLDVDVESDAGSQVAIEGLRQVLTDPSRAEEAWDILVKHALKLARGGRWDREGVVKLLQSRGLRVRPLGPDAAWLDQIEQARALHKKYRSRTAAGILDHLTDELEGKNVPPAIRRQLHAVRGAAALALRDDSGAVEHFERALAFIPPVTGGGRTGDDLKMWNDARRNYGAALLLRGDQAAAGAIASEIVASDPQHAAGFALLALARSGAGSTVPAEVEDSADYRAARARLAAQRGAWREAADLLSHLVSTGGAHPSQSIDYAQALLNLSTELPQGEEHSRVLGMCARAAGEAIRALEAGELDAELGRAFFVRARAREALGVEDRARADYERAASLSPRDPNIVLRAAMRAYADGGARTALGILTENAAGFAPGLRIIRAGWLAEIAEARAAETEVSKALDELPAVATAGSSDIHLQCADVALKIGNIDLAGRALNAFADGEIGRDEPDVAVLRGRLAIARNEWVAAEREFREAASVGDGKQSNTILGEFATALTAAGQYDAALPVFADANATTPAHPAFRHFILALMKARRFEEIVAVTAALETNAAKEGETLASLPSIVLDAAIDVAWMRDEFHEAARLLDARLSQEGSLESASPALILPAAHAHSVIGDATTSLELLEALLGRDISPEDQMRAANVLVGLHLCDRAIEVAFKAVRARPADSQMISNFISVVIAPTRRPGKRDHKEDRQAIDGLTPGTEQETNEDKLDDGAGDEDIGEDGRVGTVAPDCFVRALSDDGQRFDYFIYKELPTDPRHHEYVVGDPAVGDLVGRRTGDIVIRNAGTWREQRLRIARVLPAVVVVFRRYLRTFATLFPHRPSFRVFKIGDSPTIESLGPLLAILHGGEAHRARILAKYDELALPLGAVARAFGGSVLETAQFLASDGDLMRSLKTEGPPHMNYATSVQTAMQAQRIVVTRPALSFLDRLGLLDVVAGRFELVCAQSTIDEWGEEIRELEGLSEQGRTYMREVRGRPSFTEIAPGAVDGLLHASRALRDRVVAEARILPRPVSSLSHQDNKWRELVGASSFDSVVVAKSENAALYADDLGLRAIAGHEYNVPSTSTVALLEALDLEGLIDSDSFERAVIQLVEYKHDMVPIRGATIAMALSGSIGSAGTSGRVLARLSDPRVDRASAALVGATALRLVATAGITTVTLESAAARIVEALIQGCDASEVMPTFISQLRHDFRLLPRDLGRILDAAAGIVAQHQVVRPAQ